MKKILLLCLVCLPLFGMAQIETSIAGFFPLEGSGRTVYNFNPGWRFHKGDIIGQGIIKPYLTTENDNASGQRVGGFGSTSV